MQIALILQPEIMLNDVHAFSLAQRAVADF